MLAVAGLFALAGTGAPAGARVLSAAAWRRPVAAHRLAAGSRSVAAAGNTVTVVLQPRSQARLAALAAAPGGTLAERRAALAALAPPVSARRMVARQLRADGLRIQTTTTWSLVVAGSPASLRRVFPRSKLGWTVPSGLAGLVTAVLGSGHAVAARPLLPPPRFLSGTGTGTGPGASAGAGGHRPGGPVATRQSSGAPPDGYTPSELAAAYQLTRPGSTGAGLTVGTAQFSGWNPATLTDFAQAEGIPLAAGQVSQIGVDGANPTSYSPAAGGEDEVSLDQEMLLATAPLADQRVYFGPDTSQGIYDTYAALAAAAAAGQVQVVSTSWGSCQPVEMQDPDYLAVQEAIARIVAAGATVFAASGDSGAYDCSTPTAPDNHLAVDFPAVLPEVVGVGGTSMVQTATDPPSFSSTAWSNPPAPGDAAGYAGDGSGGGQSEFTPRPAYQDGIDIPGTTQLSSTAFLGRLVPDIASDANPDTGVQVYLDDAQGEGLAVIGGTSAAAPVQAGMLAATLSSLDCPEGLGDIHAQLYANPADFTEITSGNNHYFQAGPGYNEVTGLGSPDWAKLAGALLPGGVCDAGRFVPLQPARLLDTRNGTGTAHPGTPAPVGPHGVLTLHVLGRGGVPVSGVSAVVLNVTGVLATSTTYLTVWPAGRGRPGTSALNLARGATVANLVTVGVGAGGDVEFYNNAGVTQVVADVEGYYQGAATSTPGDLYVPLTPSRVLDTRDGTGGFRGPLGPGQSLSFAASGVGGVPAGAAAVALTLTAVSPTSVGYLQAYPGGSPRPLSSTLNLVPGATVANLVIVPLGSAGTVSVYNPAGTVQVVADVEGYFAGPASAAPPSSHFVAVAPVRLLDTRIPGGALSGPLGPGGTRTLTLPGTGGLPTSGVAAVVFNLTAVAPSAATYLTVFPGGAARPLASNLDAAPGQTVANLVIVPLGSTGTVSIYNNAGSTQVLVDLVGYFTPAGG